MGFADTDSADMDFADSGSADSDFVRMDFDHKDCYHFLDLVECLAEKEGCLVEMEGCFQTYG